MKISPPKEYLRSPPTPVPWIAKAMLVATTGLVAYGLVYLSRDPVAFRVWIREDGLVEWLTVAVLGAMAAYCAALAIVFGRRGEKSARRLWILLAGLFVFGALEEISYGQRIFGIPSPEWFVVHNDQHETNLHNLKIGSLKINKLVFGKLLGIGLGLHLLLLPVLYRMNERVRAFVDARRIPVPRLYQVLVFGVLAGACEAGVSVVKKAAEIRELVAVVVYQVILVHPHNDAAFPERVPFFGAIGAAFGRLRDAFRRLPALVRFAAAVAAVDVAFYTAFRGLFSAIFEPTALLPSFEALARSWYLGFKFDLRLALVLLLPVLLLSWVPGVGILRARGARRLWLGYLVATGAAVFFLYAVDIGHYAYLDERLSLGILEHIRAPAIAAEMVWESYPVVWIFLGLGAITLGYALALRRFAFRELDRAGPPLAGFARVAVAVGAALLGAFAIYGKLSWYPLRWSDAYFSTNSYAAALALNPVHHLYDTLDVDRKAYDVDAVRRHYGTVAAYLDIDDPDAQALRFLRRVEGAPRLPRRPNIVIVFIESFASFKTGVGGNPLDSTPEFDALARRSLYFPHFYVPCGPTAPSVFTSLFSIPDVSRAQSASENPLIVRQRTVVNAFRGYDKMYFIGGSAAWGNIRAMLAHNIPDLKLYEEGSYRSPRNDTWGISDLHLFEEANQVLRARPKDAPPFIAFIQTAGNHEPYTIPDDRRDFRSVEVEQKRLTEGGFKSLRALNGIRFMDYAIGHFFRLASREAYYEDTVFLLYGDHGTASTPGLPEVVTRLRRHHVPFVIHAPRFFPEPRRVESVASSLDVLPTAAGLAGLTYETQCLGWDLLAPRSRAERYALIDEGWHYGLIDDEFYYSTDSQGLTSGLYRYRSETPADDVSKQFPERAARMAELSLGLHETARYLLFHNRPE